MKISISGTKPLVIRIAGKLDDSNDLDLIPVPVTDEIEIDLSELTMINSVGIRNFRSWSAKLRSDKLSFSYCPRIFIDQVNMVEGFIPDRSKIQSFYVPFYSDSLDEEKSVLYSRFDQFTAEDGEYTLKHLKVTDSHGQEMELDVLERYFSFLTKY